MQPFLFGDSDRQLYGVYNPPSSSEYTDSGVLLCYPVGQEYMRCHWACRLLVNRLAGAGVHCMRFDYSCSGDSAGAFVDARLMQWLADASSGLMELKDISGVSRFSLTGMRMGAAIAALAPVSDYRVSTLVLWDPVVKGVLYTDELREMQKSLLERLKNLHKNRIPQQQQGVEELLGFRYSDSMITDIESVNLLETDKFSATDIYLFVSEERDEYEQLREHLLSLGFLKGYQLVSSSGEWGNLREIENALIAGDMINLLGSTLTSR